jgi:hypothetical protein
VSSHRCHDHQGLAECRGATIIALVLVAFSALLSQAKGIAFLTKPEFSAEKAFRPHRGLNGEGTVNEGANRLGLKAAYF